MVIIVGSWILIVMLNIGCAKPIFSPFWKPSVTLYEYVVSFWVRQSLRHAWPRWFFLYADQIEETLTRSPCASEAFTYAKRIMTRPLPKLQTDFFRAAQWKKQPPNGVYEIGYLLNYKCYDVKGPPNGWLLGWQSSQIFWRTPTMMNCQIMFNPLLNPMKSHYRFHWITTRAIKIPWKIDRT
jgi:hypothetical protein